ncbi:MFS transporter [Phytoactinopolyspora halotolerans]|uniref:MFS transporter n=1 Tax=Phytoactinopolyspora halotolerans TaxID=1981512 RepID=A0A6L9SFB5_9ACTN|nr:MFS transporter [Phytoactinopolyspora halotolerans]NEE03896.1 MFS transporter [Phytoactinopolyspora halotolerans]
MWRLPAHLAAAGAFLVAGLVFGTWAARIPAIKADLGLTDGQLALVLIALNGGAVAGLQVGAWIVGRLGDRATVRLALPGYALFLVPIALAPNLPALTVAVAMSAVVNSIVDVAINTNGIGVERRSVRPVLSRLHALLTLGGIVGAGIAALAARLGIGVVPHFAGIAVAAAAAAIALSRWLAPDHPAVPVTDATPVSGRWILGLGALAWCVTLGEGSGNDWTAVYLHRLGASEAVAATGVVAFLGAMTFGRLMGDHLRARFGTVILFRASAATAAAGLGTALLINVPAAGFVGFALLGLGVSVTLPLLLGAASHRAANAGRSPASAVAQVSMVAYLGSLSGPMLIGALATTTSLRTALMVPVAAAAVAAVAARIIDRH